jgi:metal-responsive CopG/Arc/MetJ family transcriptional regulator
MSKGVISVRLSQERLAQLDEVCQRLQMNRSQVIDSALRLLPELISGTAELTYAPPNLEAHRTSSAKNARK